jgi:hypothetical protein
LPVTLAVPTVVPPEVQVVGAEACGPKTVKVMVPPGLVPPDKVAETAALARAVPAVPPAGPVALNVGEALATTVSDMPDPQVDVAGLLFPSPL